MSNSKEVSKSTIERLPKYLRYLIEIDKMGAVDISSTTIAEHFNFNPIQVRKDIAQVSKKSGKPKTGFKVKELIKDIQNFLGYNNYSEAVIVGCGGLGKTLMAYSGFLSLGLKIVAAFDSNPALFGLEVNGLKIHSMEELDAVINKTSAKIGIITVPRESAQQVCDRLIECGIKGIWNFAPLHLVVPSDVAIRNEDMAASLAVLSYELAAKQKSD
ncbi:MAG: redox-sensing transcriptional repressor Rex [Clostridiales bacterium]|nr:redox-sensing transcriptional repressor Rex [Clostridiales bacterium]